MSNSYSDYDRFMEEMEQFDKETGSLSKPECFTTTHAKGIIVNKEDLMVRRHVVESNEFIEVYISLSSEAQKFLYTTISMIGKDDKELFGYTFSVKDLKTFFHNNSNTFYDRMRKAADELSASRFVIQLPDGSFKMVAVVREITYNRRKNELYIQLEEKLSKYFLELKRNFTQVPLSDFLELSSSNSMRLLALICFKWNIAIHKVKPENRINFTCTFDFPIDNLKRMFFYNVQNSTTEFKNIKARLLTPTTNELNKKSRFNIKLSYITGPKRKVVAVRFHLSYSEKGKLIQATENGSNEALFVNWRDGKEICEYFEEEFQIPPKEIYKLHQKYQDFELKATYLSMKKYMTKYSGASSWEKPENDEEEGVIHKPIAMLKGMLRTKDYSDIEELGFLNRKATKVTFEIINREFQDTPPGTDYLADYHF